MAPDITCELSCKWLKARSVDRLREMYVRVSKEENGRESWTFVETIPREVYEPITSDNYKEGDNRLGLAASNLYYSRIGGV